MARPLSAFWYVVIRIQTREVARGIGKQDSEDFATLGYRRVPGGVF